MISLYVFSFWGFAPRLPPGLYRLTYYGSSVPQGPNTLFCPPEVNSWLPPVGECCVVWSPICQEFWCCLNITVKLRCQIMFLNSCCYYFLALFFYCPRAPRSSGPGPRFIDLSDRWFLCQWLGFIFFGSMPQCWLTWLIIAISKVDGDIYIFQKFYIMVDLVWHSIDRSIWNVITSQWLHRWSQNFDIKKSQIWCISSFWQKIRQSVPRGLDELTCRTAL